MAEPYSVHGVTVRSIEYREFNRNYPVYKYVCTYVEARNYLDAIGMAIEYQRIVNPHYMLYWSKERPITITQIYQPYKKEVVYSHDIPEMERYFK